MNNEPVAWIEPDVIPLTHIIKAVVRREQDEQYSIPLYTHPVKEQDTDCQYCKQGCIRCDARKQLTDEEILIEAKYQPNLGYYLACEYDVLDFARAILRKAQEK